MNDPVTSFKYLSTTRVLFRQRFKLKQDTIKYNDCIMYK